MNDLPITEDLDFHYLLELMPSLSDEPEFAWLPELFVLVGYESLIQLCKYAGGESIKIPTLDALSDSVDALKWFYNVYIKKSASANDIPWNLQNIVNKVVIRYAVDGACENTANAEISTNL